MPDCLQQVGSLGSRILEIRPPPIRKAVLACLKWLVLNEDYIGYNGNDDGNIGTNKEGVVSLVVLFYFYCCTVSNRCS